VKWWQAIIGIVYLIAESLSKKKADRRKLNEEGKKAIDSGNVSDVNRILNGLPKD
jgi:hypothetical protein